MMVDCVNPTPCFPKPVQRNLYSTVTDTQEEIVSSSSSRRPSWLGLHRRAPGLLPASRENVLGSFHLCRNPVFICGIPTDWLENSYFWGRSAASVRFRASLGRVMLNGRRRNMNTYASTISPSHLSGTRCANEDHQGHGGVVIWIQIDAHSQRSTQPGLYGSYCRPGLGG